TGFTINMPLPAGTGDEGYRLAFEEVVIPVLRASAPQLLIISAGYDAHAGDPLGGMLLSAAGFGTLAQMVLDARPDRSKVAAVLEGGYKLTHLSNSVLATLAAFTGRSVPVVERSSGGPETPYSVLRSRIRQVRSVVRNYWNI
ncbi:MAG TPA: histone deacetylase, partial [bacterium]|nr:histone deacetylase [bacterium]